MTNIAEILKYCPKGTKLYSPICGDCILTNIDLEATYSIEVKLCSNNDNQLFTKEGLFLTQKIPNVYYSHLKTKEIGISSDFLLRKVIL